MFIIIFEKLMLKDTYRAEEHFEILLPNGFIAGQTKRNITSDTHTEQQNRIIKLVESYRIYYNKQSITKIKLNGLIMLTKYRVIKYSRSLLLKNFSTRVIDGRENNGSSSAAIIEKIEDLKNWKEELLKTMRIHPEFISEDEEKQLFNEIEPYIKRLRYEFSHWDDVNNDIKFYNNYFFLFLISNSCNLFFFFAFLFYRRYMAIERRNMLVGMKTTRR